MRTKLSMKKKTAATITAGVLVAGTAAGAYAYWTTTGTGTGTGATTAGTATLSFTQSALTAMYPGDSAQTLTVSVKNVSTTESAYVASVKAFITTDKSGCTGADFKIGGAVAPSTALTATALTWTPVDLAATAAANATSTIQFNNTTSNQDVCKSAVVTVNYVAS